MGQWCSQYELESITPYSKNKDYYSGDRFFKVSRGLYPNYNDGYLWGRYEDKTYWFNLGWDEKTQSYYPLEKGF